MKGLRFSRVLFILMILFVSVAGISYGYWSDSLSIFATISITRPPAEEIMEEGLQITTEDAIMCDLVTVPLDGKRNEQENNLNNSEFIDGDVEKPDDNNIADGEAIINEDNNSDVSGTEVTNLDNNVETEEENNAKQNAENIEPTEIEKEDSTVYEEEDLEQAPEENIEYDDTSTDFNNDNNDIETEADTEPVNTDIQKNDDNIESEDEAGNKIETDINNYDNYEDLSEIEVDTEE
ncbi:MAG: hypothetical protein GX957_07410 [Clostridiaceae bacterium]|nr:hypothetical protein [Clostridiaceae bacterium]